jgi:hypothetical protein
MSILPRVGNCEPPGGVEIEKNNLKSTIYAYLRGGIPLILGILLIDHHNPNKPDILGKHAVAVTGYSMIKNSTFSNYPELNNLSLKACSMDKIYAHDDQVGPFSRLTIDEQTGFLKNSWGYKKYGDDDTIVALPLILLIPLYHKIRIPFDSIRATIVHFDSFIEILRAKKLLPFEGRLDWDIYITTNSGLKKQLSESSLLKGNYRKEVLTEGMPKYIWRATASVKGDILIDLLFDATDTWQGKFFIRAIEYNALFCTYLKIVAKNPAIFKLLMKDDEIETRPVWRVFEWFKLQPTPPMSNAS